MLIGLAAKNAILIVEFAKAKHDEGMSLEDASLTSARLRFRPILMTAFAFILGVIPLMKASGAGAGAQNVMGTGVFWGMLVATFMGVFLIPGNYTFIEGLGRRKKHAPAEEPPSATGEETREIVHEPSHAGHEPPAVSPQPTEVEPQPVLVTQSAVTAELQPAVAVPADGKGEPV
jgi:hypothetical protein